MYHMEKGRVHSGLTRVVWELNEVAPGDGGTLFLSGSHKVEKTPCTGIFHLARTTHTKTKQSSRPYVRIHNVPSCRRQVWQYVLAMSRRPSRGRMRTASQTRSSLTRTTAQLARP